MNDILKESRKENIAKMRRVRRLSLGLNAAIRQGNPNRINHWQVIGLNEYGIPFADWAASQVEVHNNESYKEFLERKGRNVPDYLNRNPRV